MTDQQNVFSVSDVKTELAQTHGRLVIEGVGELTFIGPHNGVIDANHTVVSPNHQGKGIAGLLFKALVSLAREQQWKINPTCSYIAKKLESNEALQDLVAKQ
ncbi:N-acetyltransferase [Neiella sp. HB171785]|uniref:N-acetyltransferase n=1 Tax=Neiella litorisoli TaxID=2771431 RepID=A0A8J6QFR3_9GAMM|nr:GNAT family N-acetyltransferase [Neiella litorisoli]MBD1388580.1 N-acetyltransferase [Neiella litorisoli]